MEFKQGLHDGISVALGYFCVAIAFGLMAVEAGCLPLQGMLISMFCVTPAGQMAGVTVMAALGSYVEMALTQIFINARYALMAISLSQKVTPDFSTVPRLCLGAMITGEIYAVTIGKDKITTKYFIGLCCLPHIGWVLGTLAGCIAGTLLPDVVTTSLSVALYGMFIGVVVPPVMSNKKTGVVVLITMVISSVIYFVPALDFISTGFAIIISAVIASAIGAVLFPLADDHEGVEDHGL